MINRQLRVWVFLLYPDNPDHKKALDYLDIVDNSLYIKHIEKRNDDGEIINKEHYHCIMKFDSPYWLSKLLDDLGLPESDSHLFHSFRDFKIKGKPAYKTIEDYVLYLDHNDNDLKLDKYSIDDFNGGLKNWAIKILSSRDEDDHLKFYDLCMFIKNYNLDHWADARYFTFTDWYGICIENGYGIIFYKQWYKMRDILKPYINV